jgi:hypothetical protein
MSADFTTYRLPQGELVYGEYAFVTTPEFFEEVDEPTAVTREDWTLAERSTVWFFPPLGGCAVTDCDDDAVEWLQHDDGSWDGLCERHFIDATGSIAT